MVLVVLVSTANLLSFAARSIITRPIATIEGELERLDALGDALLSFAYEINRVDSEDFALQVQEIQLSKARLDEAFEHVDQAEVLLTLNDTTTTALKALPRFRQQLDQGFTSFLAECRGVTEAANEIVGEGNSFTTLDLRTVEMEEAASVDRIQQSLTALYEASHVMDVITAGAIQNLATQSRIITQEIDRLEALASRSLFALIGFIFVVSVSIGLLITNRIGKRIQAIERGIQRMKEGDLADRIAVVSRDELGRLSRDVNVFTDALGHSMSRIKNVSGSNVSIKKQLVDSVSTLTQMVVAVSEGAESISGDMDRLEATIRSSGNTVRTVETQVEHLKNALNEQITMIEESTASVTEMISSVASVSTVTQKKRESMGELGRNAADGLKKMQTTTEIVQTIHNSIDEIHGAVAVIKDMAERTNLLAMNAAIEAAHAGESGRGFAVVAEEIRKLAEASGTNSNRIDGVLSAIVGNIQRAADAGETTREVFRKIDHEVEEAISSFEEIARSTEEVRSGGQQILEAMSHLNQVSNQVTESSDEMTKAVTDNRKAVEEVTSLSGYVVERVESIRSSADQMNLALEAVTQETKRIDAISETLDTEVSVYKTGVEEMEDETELLLPVSTEE
jgi:methyl-accepting chemotaxis protein